MSRRRVTVRAEGVELRGYVDGWGQLVDLSNAVQAMGAIVIASPADDDYDPFVGPLLTPETWCRALGWEILDHDGWRGRDAPPWGQPISQAEFERRVAECTARRVEPS